MNEEETNEYEKKSTKVVYAQAPVLEWKLEELKRLSGKKTTKDALNEAIDHYLTCPLVRMKKEEKKEERKPRGDEWWWYPEHLKEVGAK